MVLIQLQRRPRGTLQGKSKNVGLFIFPVHWYGQKGRNMCPARAHILPYTLTPLFLKLLLLCFIFVFSLPILARNRHYWTVIPNSKILKKQRWPRLKTDHPTKTNINCTLTLSKVVQQLCKCVDFESWFFCLIVDLIHLYGKFPWVKVETAARTRPQLNGIVSASKMCTQQMGCPVTSKLSQRKKQYSGLSSWMFQ